MNTERKVVMFERKVIPKTNTSILVSPYLEVEAQHVLSSKPSNRDSGSTSLPTLSLLDQLEKIHNTQYFVKMKMIIEVGNESFTVR